MKLFGSIYLNVFQDILGVFSNVFFHNLLQLLN
jgi:hypothetical protein